MEALHQLILERNARETTPFVDIHQANATLWKQVDSLQAKCDELEKELVVQLANQNTDEEGHMRGTLTQSSALRNETRLQEKLEKLQEEFDEKVRLHAEEQSSASEVAKDLASNKDTIKEHEETIKKLSEENDKKEKAIEHLTSQLDDAKSRTKLAEQQYVGLKDTIRVLQEENDAVKKENRLFESRLVSDKATMVEEMNSLSATCERLKKEVDMLRSLNTDEAKRSKQSSSMSSSSWFGLSSPLGISKSTSATTTSGTKPPPESKYRKFDPKVKVVVPSKPKQTIIAHTSEAACIR